MGRARLATFLAKGHIEKSEVVEAYRAHKQAMAARHHFGQGDVAAGIPAPVGTCPRPVQWSDLAADDSDASSGSGSVRTLGGDTERRTTIVEVKGSMSEGGGGHGGGGRRGARL